MRDESTEFDTAATTNWQRRVDIDLSDAIGSSDFDVRFVRHMLTLLDEAGFNNVAHAVLTAMLDLARGNDNREEFDALIDLAIQLMTRDDRAFSKVLPPDSEES